LIIYKNPRDKIFPYKIRIQPDMKKDAKENIHEKKH